MRRRSNCWTFCTSPIAESTSAPPNMARSTMILRPYRSAKAPQMGEKMAMAAAWVAISAPDQYSTAARSLMPRSCT